MSPASTFLSFCCLVESSDDGHRSVNERLFGSDLGLSLNAVCSVEERLFVLTMNCKTD